MSNFDAVTYSAIKALKLQGGDSTPSTGLASDVGTMVMVPANFTSEYYVDTGTVIDATKDPELATMFPSYFDGTSYGDRTVEVNMPPIQVRSKWWVGEELEKKFLTFDNLFFCFHGSVLTRSDTDDFLSFIEVDTDVQLLGVMGSSLLIYRPSTGISGIFTLGAQGLSKTSDVTLGFVPKLMTYSDNNEFFIFGEDSKIHKSSNLSSWAAIGDLSGYGRIYDFIVNGSTIIATTLSASIVSKDGGGTWTSITHLSRILPYVATATSATTSATKVFWDSTTSAYYSGVNGQTINAGLNNMIISKSSDGLSWSAVPYSGGGNTIGMGGAYHGKVISTRPHRFGDNIIVSMSWGYGAPNVVGIAGASFTYIASAAAKPNQFMFNNSTRIKGLNYNTVYHIGALQVPNLQGRTFFWEFRKVVEATASDITAAQALTAKPLMPGSKQYQYVKEVAAYDSTKIAIPLVYPEGGMDVITYYKTTDNWATHQVVTFAPIAGNRIGYYTVGNVGSTLYVAYGLKGSNGFWSSSTTDHTTFTSYLALSSYAANTPVPGCVFHIVDATGYPVFVIGGAAIAKKTISTYSVLNVLRTFNTSRLKLNIATISSSFSVINSASTASILANSTGGLPNLGYQAMVIGYQVNSAGDTFLYLGDYTGGATTIQTFRVTTIVKTAAGGTWSLGKVFTLGPFVMPGVPSTTKFYSQGNVFIGFINGSGATLTTSDYGQTWSTTSWPAEAILDSDAIMSSKDGLVTGAPANGYGYEIVGSSAKMKMTTGGGETSMIPVVTPMSENTKWVVKVK